MIEKEKEIWKNIPGYEGYYQASNLGRVRSLDRTVIYKNEREYFYKGRLIGGVFLMDIKRFFYLNTENVKHLKYLNLVAMAFLGT